MLALSFLEFFFIKRKEFISLSFFVLTLASSLPVLARVTIEDKNSILLEEIKSLIVDGKLIKAQKYLDQALLDRPRNLNLLFLRADIAMRMGDYNTAITSYRNMLDQDPNLVRVRLELARAYFMKKDDDQAEYHFRLVLGGKPSPAVVRNIEAFLEVMEKRRRWRLEMALSIAPDSNVNVAPTIRTVEIFGLPFDLSDDARRKSGIGLFGNVGGDYNLPITEKINIHTRAYLQRSQYKDSRYNDTYVLVSSGPRFLFNKSELAVLATGSRRWYGEKPYTETYGVRFEGGYVIRPRFSLSGGFEIAHLAYQSVEGRSGRYASADVVATYGLSSRSFVRSLASFYIEDTELSIQKQKQWRFGVGHYYEFSGGLTSYIQPEISFSRYDEKNIFFMKKRKDNLFRIRTTLTKRDWQVWGFAPQVTYTYSKNLSNINIYDYQRHQFQFGVTRQF